MNTPLNTALARATLLVLLSIAAAAPVAAATHRRLVLVGGGAHPAAAMKTFVEWAGGRAARIVVVPWATEYQEESANDLVAEFTELGAGSVTPAVAKTPDEARRFADQMRTATGIFFGGGDQAHLVDMVVAARLGDLLRERYGAGCVFGGTSAGTAAMAEVMITGDGDFEVIDGTKVVTRRGIGVVRDALVDQHFLKRARENRLIGLVLSHPDLVGIGIDEGTAALVTDDRLLEVVGPTQVVIFDAHGASRLSPRAGISLRMHVLVEGARYDIRQRKVLGR